MVALGLSNVIHFHHLSQYQLNELIKVSNQLDLNCCYLGHQEVGLQDLLLISSTTKLSELKKIRSSYKNWIYLLMEKPLCADDLNELNDMGKIYYLDSIDVDKIKYRFELLNNNVVTLSDHIEEEEKDQTLAIISHDLKNPLNAIRLDAQILLRYARKGSKQNLAEDVKRSVARIIKTTDRLGLLVSDLLDNNKSGNALITLTRHFLHMEVIVDEVIEVIAPIAKRNSIKIKKTIESNVPPLLADKNKLFQVILNLISNAIKFSYQHTSIHIHLSAHDGHIHFQVEDSGPGIDPETEHILYERFRAGNKRECGSGLGLYICKTIIEAHKGEISHRKGQKGGAVFEFSLPLVMKDSVQQVKKVYLIDDDEDLRDVLSWALNTEGFHVESFSCSKTAMEYLRTTQERPSLILSDFNILAPDFLEIKHDLNLGHVPLVFMTTVPEKVKSRIDHSSYSEILAKPLDLEKFIQTVSRYFLTL